MDESIRRELTSAIEEEDDGATGFGLEGGIEGVAPRGLLVGVHDHAGHGAAVVGDPVVGDRRVVVAPDVLRRDHPHAARLHHESPRCEPRAEEDEEERGEPWPMARHC